MADIFFVCVRDDLPAAEALAEVFVDAGCSICEGSLEKSLSAHGAGIVLWSRPAIESKAFLDFALRVADAGRAVVAGLIKPPPASVIGATPAFDLTKWRGEAEDPLLDPLFFAVDHLVTAAREKHALNGPRAVGPGWNAPLPSTPARRGVIAARTPVLASRRIAFAGSAEVRAERVPELVA